MGSRISYVSPGNLATAVSQVRGLVDSKLSTSGGTLNGDLKVKGNVNANYVVGTWLQTTTAGDIGGSPYSVAVIRSDGWIYAATPQRIVTAGADTLTDAEVDEIISGAEETPSQASSLTDAEIETLFE